MIDPADKAVLLATARHAIQYGLQHGRPPVPDTEDCSASLQDAGASFVTLTLHQQLRGCIGSLQACRPLIVDVTENAYAAAFHDPRFPPVNEAEFPELDYHISILHPAEPLQFSDEHDLLRQIRPQVDGLILEDQGHRGTFLPSVWDSLPEPGQFLQQLKRKAGLPADYWSGTLKVWRYTVENVE